MIGNGYGVADGMIVGMDGKRIDKYPKIKDWDKLIGKCIAKVKKFSDEFYGDTDKFEMIPELKQKYKERQEAYLAERCAIYGPVSVDDSHFTEESLYKDLTNAAPNRDAFLRPYPLSTDYSDIYHLNEQTPKWFLQIALNLCNAWIRFLTEDINNGNIYKEPPTPLIGEQFINNTDDYANLEWTTKHRDMLVELAEKFKGLIAK